MFVVLQVAKGQEYFVSVDGLAYADDYSISMTVPPTLSADPDVQVTPLLSCRSLHMLCLQVVKNKQDGHSVTITDLQALS